mgnify:CR=1 FL=1
MKTKMIMVELIRIEFLATKILSNGTQNICKDQPVTFAQNQTLFCKLWMTVTSRITDCSMNGLYLP